MIGKREDHLKALSERTFDIVVIGAGITGAGSALDAVARGLDVAVLDKGDIASGTSSWSTKLIHGGIRYLEKLDLPMVREGLRERYILRRIAPFLVWRILFLYPVAGGALRGVIVNCGLWLYDLLAGRSSLGRHRRVSPRESAALAPLCNPWNKRGFRYYDGQTDDARLTLTILLSAAERGAVVATYCEVMEFIKEDGRIVGVRARDVCGGGEVVVHARSVINATGVWMDRIQQIDDPTAQVRVVPSKGAHLVVSTERLPLQSAVIMPVTSDGRVLFAVPWEGRVLLGTTDNLYTGDLDHPAVEIAEVAYIMEHVNRYFQANLITADIIATYAGLRPLISSATKDRDHSSITKDISRRHIVLISASGLVSVGGGKLTTYRVMACGAVEAALKVMGCHMPYSVDTAHLPLLGTEGYESLCRRVDELSKKYNVHENAVYHLLHRYGDRAMAILELVADNSALAAPLVPGLPYLVAEALYSARHELVATLEDVLARRMRLLLLDEAQGTQVAERVALLISPELGWDEGRIIAEVARYGAYARRVAILNTI